MFYIYIYISYIYVFTYMFKFIYLIYIFYIVYIYIYIYIYHIYKSCEMLPKIVLIKNNILIHDKVSAFSKDLHQFNFISIRATPV